jgi:HSP20 family protein
MMDELYAPFAPLMRLHNQMNRLFEDFFEDMPAGRGYAATYPGVNLWEDGDNAYVEAELPGLSMDDVQVFVTGNELTIGGERKMNEPTNASYHRRERASGQFSRMLTLPWEIDPEQVEARLRDGVLTIKLAKAESAKPKKVKILSA